MIRPNASWVDAASVRRPCGSTPGTGYRRCIVALDPAAEGHVGQKRGEPAGLTSSPASTDHSSPAGIACALCRAAICSGVISPEWLSLWPASGRPHPLTV